MNDNTKRYGGTRVGAWVVEADSIDLSALLRSAWRGKFIILLSTLAALSLGWYYANNVATPKYRSTAVVMLNTREEQVVDLGNVMGGLGSDRPVVNTEVELLKSRNLLGKVVDELHLVSDPEFNGVLRPPSQIDLIKGQVIEWITGRSPASAAPPSPGVQRDITIDALLRSLTVANLPDSLVFKVTIETTAATKSAEIANALVELHILNQLEVKFEATEQATTWLTERVTGLQIALEEAEEKVNDFRASSSLISPEALRNLEVQLNDLRERITNTQGTLNATESLLADMREAQTPAEKAAVSKDMQLQRLLLRIDTPSATEAFDLRFEEVLSRSETEVTRMRGQLETLRNSRSVLETQIEQQSQDLITLQQLSREAEASRLLYEYFLARLKETSAQKGVQQADSRVISSAVVPREASAPRKSLIQGFAGIIGFALGIAIVLVREMNSRTFRRAEEIESMTDTNVIGQIPNIPARRRQDALAYIKKRPASAVAEAVRNLRTSIMLSNVDNPPKVIMICSSLPGEGKTTVAFSLALNFSSMGKKVLLVEGDIRRLVFRQYLKSDQKHGIVSILSGNKTIDEVIIKDEFLGSDVLLGDKGGSNAADIFSSERFGRLISDLREQYDVILIDTPPVLIVPDARVICQHVDSTVFVVRWDVTDRNQVIIINRDKK
uniref:GumC family protein n=1 Tax=Hyphomonas atlantica TaxID=1280948 RepID=UPI003512D490